MPKHSNRGDLITSREGIPYMTHFEHLREFFAKDMEEGNQGWEVIHRIRSSNNLEELKAAIDWWCSWTDEQTVWVLEAWIEKLMDEEYTIYRIMESKETYLFKLDTLGRLRIFHLEATKVEDGAVIISRKGLIYGQHQEDREIIYPKNVGRANETTPFQQAVLELESKVKKLQDKGYIIINDWEDVGERRLYAMCSEHVGLDAQGNVAPMLAQKNLSKAFFPCYIQPKVNGLRCFIERIDGQIQFRSRRGKIFTSLGHLEDVLMDNLPMGVILDGELYGHGISLQRVNSLVKRYQPETLNLEFYLFDCYNRNYPDMGFEERWIGLRNLHRQHLVGKGFDLIDTRHIRERERLEYWYQKWLDMKWEGLMWRDPDGEYEPGKRSYGLIKYKPTFDGEFEIVDVEEATGRDTGTAVLICVTEDGLHFHSRPKGTRAERGEYWDRRDELIGKFAKVIYDELSDLGKPLRNRTESIRELWD